MQVILSFHAQFALGLLDGTTMIEDALSPSLSLFADSRGEREIRGRTASIFWTPSPPSSGERR